LHGLQKLQQKKGSKGLSPQRTLFSPTPAEPTPSLPNIFYQTDPTDQTDQTFPQIKTASS
jgi:hypothetical protein